MLRPCYGEVASFDRVATEWTIKNLGKTNEWPRGMTEWLGFYNESPRGFHCFELRRALARSLIWSSLVEAVCCSSLCLGARAGVLVEPCRRRALLTCVDAAASELATLRASARSAVQMLRKRCGRTSSVSPPHRLMILASVCCFLEADVRVSVLVMRVLWRSWKHGRCMSHAALAELLERIRADATLSDAAKTSLAGRGGARLLLRLGRLVAKARVAMWLVSVNSPGVAVSTAQLVARLRVLWPPAARGWQRDAFLARARQWPRRRKAYAKTFRLRWGVAWRRLPSRANLDADDLLFRASCDQFFYRKWVPGRGATFGTHFWGLCCCVILNEAPIEGTKSSPTKWSSVFRQLRYGRSSRGRSGSSTWCCRTGSACSSTWTKQVCRWL